MEQLVYTKHSFNNTIILILFICFFFLINCKKECFVNEEPNCDAQNNYFIGSWNTLIITETFKNGSTYLSEKRFITLFIQDSILIRNDNLNDHKWHFKCEDHPILSIEGMIKDSITDYSINEITENKIVFSGLELRIILFPSDTLDVFSSYYLIK